MPKTKPVFGPSKQSDTPSRTHEGKGEGAEHKRDVQIECFHMSVDGYTVREIAGIMSISPTTVSKYVRAEEKIRSEQLEDQRETEKARRLSRLFRLSRLAEDSRSIPGSGALGACGKFEEMINRILGVDAPTKIDATLTTLAEALREPDDPHKSLE